MAERWENRIVGSGVKPASQFIANPLNFRTHPQTQRDAVTASITTLGWLQQVIVNRRTGYLIDGHERVMNAMQHDDQDVPYIEVDLSPSEERLALATFDPIGEMATVDSEILDQLLRDVSTGEPALQELLTEVAKDAGLDYSAALDDDDESDDGAEEQDAPGRLYPIPIMLTRQQLKAWEDVKAARKIKNDTKVFLAVTGLE